MQASFKSKLGSLSGGERQRVLFAQAMIPEPSLLVLDEPMTGLDLTGKEILEGAIRDFAKGGGTVVWVNHDIVQVNEIADAMTYINRLVLLDGAPREVLAGGAAAHLFPTLALPAREVPQGMSSLYEIPRQFIIHLAETNVIHYTFSYAFVVNGFLCALVEGPLLAASAPWWWPSAWPSSRRQWAMLRSRAWPSA